MTQSAFSSVGKMFQCVYMHLDDILSSAYTATNHGASVHLSEEGEVLPICR